MPVRGALVPAGLPLNGSEQVRIYCVPDAEYEALPINAVKVMPVSPGKSSKRHWLPICALHLNLKPMWRFLYSLLLLGCALQFTPVSAQGQATIEARVADLAGDGAVLLNSPAGESLVSVNPDTALIPASVVKVPLAHVALTALGEEFRFATQFFRNGSGDLLIRGLGDPFLVSEEISLIAEALAAKGLRRVRRLVVDDSAFVPSLDLPLELGANDPYAARNSALAVNFNTVNLAWNPDGSLISGEEQTPLTPIARELAAPYSPGEHAVAEPIRINLGDDPEAGLRQVQQLFRVFMERAGIEVEDPAFYREAKSNDWSLYYSHPSTRSLRFNLEGMLRYSNNFIANQLFLVLGAQESGYPATVASARAVLRENLAELYGAGFGGDAGTLLMLEGSGLAREQRATAAGMMRVLEAFTPFADLLPEIRGVLRKSGTLTGVYNYVGYIPGDAGLYPFVILTNQPVNNRDEILGQLQRLVN